jgi:LacI family transcriptional regulator
MPNTRWQPVRCLGGRNGRSAGPGRPRAEPEGKVERVHGAADPDKDPAATDELDADKNQANPDGSDGPITIQDVAKVAGVHYSTVSRALDPAKAWRVGAATRLHVETVALQMGYRRHLGASGLKRGRTHTVGVIVADLGNPFISPVLRGLANRLDEANLMLLITETQDNPAALERVLNHLVERRVDAVVVAAARLGNASILTDVARRQIPLLLVDRDVPQSGLPSCTHDHKLGGALAAQHLLDLGHRRIAQLRGPADVSSFVSRGFGFAETLAAAGVTELDLRSQASLPSLEQGRRLLMLLLDREPEPPTAIFAHNDLMALGALEGLAARGLRCPDQISVVGYNDSPLVDRVTPPLTTIRLHAQELGRLVGDMTVAAIRSPEHPPSSLQLPPTLVVRASTARPADLGGGAAADI